MRKLNNKEIARLQALLKAASVVVTDESLSKEERLDMSTDMFLLKDLIEKGYINEPQIHKMESDQDANHVCEGFSDEVPCKRELQSGEDGPDAGPRDPSLLH